MRTVILIPAYNEASRIAATVTAACSVSDVDSVIVIDDGSTDSTAEEARAAGAEIIKLAENVGKGAALDAGYAHVRAQADVIVLLDGDLGDSAREAATLLAPIRDNRADMVIAQFPRPTGKAGFGLVKKLARYGIRRLGDRAFNAQAPLSGQRALTAAALDAVTPFEFGFGVEVALTVRALRSGLRVVEVPTTMSHAATGRDLAGFRHRGTQFAHVAGALVRLAFERRSTD